MQIVGRADAHKVEGFVRQQFLVVRIDLDVSEPGRQPVGKLDVWVDNRREFAVGRARENRRVHGSHEPGTDNSNAAGHDEAFLWT